MDRLGCFPGRLKRRLNSAHFVTTVHVTPPPPLFLGTALRKNCPLVPLSNSRTSFFARVLGFFMVLVDVAQLFRCAGHHFMCVATGPPIRGDPISHSQAHFPLKPLPPALDPFPEATSP